MSRISTNKVIRILIDGVEPTNTVVTKFTTTFQLEQCFCQCSVRIPYEHNGIIVEEHYPSCSNADPARYIGPVEK